MPLDPIVAQLISAARENGFLPLHRETPTEARESYRRLALLRAGDTEPEPVAAVREESIPGPGDVPLAVRVYTPDDAIPATVVFLHGGGWVIGDLDTHDAVCRSLANATRATVASVDYRRAPESPHPGPLEDSLAAVRWAAETWPDHRLAVAGDSAGGSLAAGCALSLRDTGGPALAAQLLVYPGLDARMAEPSVAENGEGYFLTAADMAWFLDCYLPDPTMRDDARVDLLRTPDLTGLPPAVLAVAEYDPLRDEGLAYARRLQEAGVPVRLVRAEGQTHGFLAMSAVVPSAADYVAEIQAAFAELLVG